MTRLGPGRLIYVDSEGCRHSLRASGFHDRDLLRAKFAKKITPRGDAKVSANTILQWIRLPALWLAASAIWSKKG
jgi:hypothetical protein